ncbi:MAG: glycosyltransferase family 4 protein [Phycisphaerae bacterium]|nr:glycosyltransferase family 4 protein [Phycisphaerae bacterium]
MSSTKYGAYERFMVTLAEQCSKRGHKFYCCFEESPWNTQITDDITAAGGEIVIMPARGKNLRFLIKMIFWLRRHRITLIHTHFNPASLLALIAARIARVPLPILSFRTGATKQLIENYPLKSRLVAWLRCRLAKRIFTVSEAVHEQYRQLGLAGNKMMTRYVGITSIPATKTRSQMRNEFNLDPNVPVIACVAFHNPMKGIDVLLRAVAILKQQFPRLRLLEVGGSRDPKETEKLRHFAEDIGVSENVIWTGHRSDVRNILECADLYCQPSRVEGLGFAILEAMSAGLAVVGTKVGGIPEVVLDGQSGVLVEPDSPEDMAAALAELLRDESGRKKMGQLGRQRARENFDLQRQTELLVDMYEEMMKKHNVS